MKTKRKAINIGSIVLIIAFTFVDGFVSVAPCFQSVGANYKAGIEVTQVAFFLLGLSFFACGLTSNMLLRKHFPMFYHRFACLLWMACFSLAIPLLVRSIVDYYLRTSKKLNDLF